MDAFRIRTLHYRPDNTEHFSRLKHDQSPRISDKVVNHTTNRTNKRGTRNESRTEGLILIII